MPGEHFIGTEKIGDRPVESPGGHQVEGANSSEVDGSKIGSGQSHMR